MTEQQLARAEKQAAASRRMLEMLQATKHSGEQARRKQTEEEPAPGGLERERRGDRRSRESATPESVRPTWKS